MFTSNAAKPKKKNYNIKPFSSHRINKHKSRRHIVVVDCKGQSHRKILENKNENSRNKQFFSLGRLNKFIIIINLKQIHSTIYYGTTIYGKQFL